MSYDGWIEFDGQEMVNVSRTVQLAETLGIDIVWTTPESVQWIQDTLAGVDYGDVTDAPWYDPGYPASAEFAGIMPLAFVGMGDSTLSSSPTEYIGDGGHSGKARNATLPIVASVVVLASTSRGADYGKRWLDRLLRSSGSRTFCSGSVLRYFRFPEEDAPVAHYRDAKTTRGTSVTRKRTTDCSVAWWLTFTLTANDPFEYGASVDVLEGLGGIGSDEPSGPDLVSSGSIVLIQESCPVYDYTPVYDPLYPALIPSPSAPAFYPDGWDIVPGATFERFWARLSPLESSFLNVVPVFTLSTTVAARMVRVSIWPGDSDVDDQCDPLFSAVVAYLPADIDFYIDGEQKASYVWDGASPSVRRTDSLVYGPEALPIQWTAFNDHDNLLVTLDIFTDSSGYEGDGEIRAALALVPKSD